MRCPRWGLLVVLAVAAPAPARAATEQEIAARDVGAEVAVDGEGRAFLVSPSTLHNTGPVSAVRGRRAAPGAAFGPSRTLLRSSRTDRAVDAGVAADGSGVIVIQSVRRPHRRVRVVTFGPRRRAGRPTALSPRGDHADFAASAVARSGAAVVVWFRHRGGRRWRLEASTREPGAAAFGPPEPLSAFVRRPCCTTVSVAIGERGDAVATWSSTSRPGVWATLRSPGHAFRRPRRLAEDSSDVPRVVVGAGGTAALLYSRQHVPRRAGDGLQVHRAAGGGAFGAAEPVDRSGRATTGEAAVTPGGHVIVAWVDQAGEEGTRVRVSEAAPAEPLVETGVLGTQATPRGLAVAAGDDGRAVVAWSELVATEPAYLEQAVAAMRPARETPFGAAVALGRPWRSAGPELARLVPGGGALVVWKASRFGSRSERRAALAVTRLP